MAYDGICSQRGLHRSAHVDLVRQPDFRRVEARVAEAERKRVALEEMLKVLHMTENFDKEDERSVEELLVQVLHEEKQCMCDLEKRRRVYEDTLRVAQEQLQQRHEAMVHLNDTSEAFILFPELAERFARRQAVMIQRMSEATEQLEAL